MKKKIKNKITNIAELADAMNEGFNRTHKEIEELKFITNKSFQTAQDHINQRFDSVDKSFNIVKEKINNISKNTVDVVRQEDFDKLNVRVDVVEEKLKLKRA